MLSLESIVKKTNRPIIVEEFEKKDAILMEEETGTIHSLNSTAYEIYSLCNCVSIQSIIEDMISRYPETNETRITNSVFNFIESLLQKELIAIE